MHRLTQLMAGSLLSAALAGCGAVPSRTDSAAPGVDPSLLPSPTLQARARWRGAHAVPRLQAREVFRHRGELAAALASVASDAHSGTDARLALRTRLALAALLRSARDEGEFLQEFERRFVCVDGFEPFALCTGYATIEATASLSRDSRFRFPLLGDIRASAPDLLRLERSEALVDRRVEALAIAWMADPLEWALVETNGTARLRMGDGSSIAISRVATNGMPWRGLGRAMAELGALDASTITLARIREAVQARPDLAEAAALMNPRFVSFAICDEGDFPPALPAGTLTRDFSCAADPAFVPFGALLFLEAEEGDAALPGFPLRCVQDAGGAIQGPARFDLYCGIGPESVRTAGALQSRARFSMLLLREFCAELGVPLTP